MKLLRSFGCSPFVISFCVHSLQRYDLFSSNTNLKTFKKTMVYVITQRTLWFWHKLAAFCQFQQYF